MVPVPTLLLPSLLNAPPPDELGLRRARRTRR